MHVKSQTFLVQLASQQFFENASPLSEEMKEISIEFTFEEKEFEVVSWNVIIKAQKGIQDWFDIDPTVSDSAGQIDQEHWRSIVEKDGVMLKDGKIQLLDAHTLQVLKHQRPHLKQIHHLHGGHHAKSNLEQYPHGWKSLG